MLFANSFKKAVQELEANRELIPTNSVADSEIDNVMFRDFSATERQKWRDLKFYNSLIQSLQNTAQQRRLDNVGVQLLRYVIQRSQQVSDDIRTLRNHRIDRVQREAHARLEQYIYAMKPYMEILDNFVLQRGIGTYPSRYSDLQDGDQLPEFLNTYASDLDLLFSLLSLKTNIPCKDSFRFFVTTAIQTQLRQLIYKSFKNQILSHLPSDETPTVDDLLQSYMFYVAQDPSSPEQLAHLVQDVLQVTASEARTLIQEAAKRFQMRMFEQSLNTPSSQINFDALSPREFESFIAEFLTSSGYVTSLTPVTGDQGADVIAEKGIERWAIQIKHYTGSVGNSAVQEVLGSMAIYGCTGSAVVTNSFFTRAAVELAGANRVELIDRNTLLSWMNRH